MLKGMSMTKPPTALQKTPAPPNIRCSIRSTMTRTSPTVVSSERTMAIGAKKTKKPEKKKTGNTANTSGFSRHKKGKPKETRKSPLGTRQQDTDKGMYKGEESQNSHDRRGP
jgi:hypothetical protein